MVKPTMDAALLIAMFVPFVVMLKMVFPVIVCPPPLD
jgi:hypothetical protein